MSAELHAAGTPVHQGSCLCGAVRFRVHGDLAAPVACHCSMCRKVSGHFWASADVPRTALVLERDGTLRWFASSERVRRGFCTQCGSALFFDALHLDRISIGMGAFDAPSGTTLARHIFVADKGDYYEIDDGLPQNLQ